MSEDVGQHVVALVPGKIEIDVGRILPLGIEEALEEEPGAERLDVGDAEAVAHDRVGHRAAAAVGGAVLDDVLHHQEVVGEALLPDDAELVLQPVAGDRRDGAVAPLGAGVGEGAEPPERLVGLRQARRHHPAVGNAILAALRDRLGLRAPPRDSRERDGRGRPRGGARRRGARWSGGRADAADGFAAAASNSDSVVFKMNCTQEPVASPVLRVRHHDGVRHRGRDAETAGGGEHGVARLAGHQLGVEIARSARRGDALEEADVAREKNETGAVGCQRGRITPSIRPPVRPSALRPSASPQ